MTPTAESSPEPAAGVRTEGDGGDRSRSRVTSAQTLAAHRDYWEQGLTLAEAAATLGISRQRLHQRFRAAGLPTRSTRPYARGAKRRKRALDALRAAYAERDRQPFRQDEYERLRRAAHREWPSSQLIADALGGGRWSAALTAAAIPSAAEHRRAVIDGRRARIRELWGEGLSLREIAAQLGSDPLWVNMEIVRMRAKGEEVPLRRPRLGRDGQRARLLGALADDVAARGYAQVTVEDVLRRTGAATTTFHDHFRDKADCFLAAFDAAADNLVRRVGAVYERIAEPSPARARAVLEAVLDTFAADPALARLCIVEVAAAGPDAIHRSTSIVNGFIGMLDQIDNYPQTGRQRRPAPPDAVARRALIGGIVCVIYNRVVSGRMELLPELLPQLTHFLLAPFLGGREAAAVAYTQGQSGRPPTPAVIHARASAREAPNQRPRRAPPGERGARILDAMTAEVAEKGYGGVTVASVYRRAGVSSRTFYDLFRNKTDCFLAAYDAAVDNLVEHVAAVYERMPEPTPARARAVLEVVLEVFAATPERARMCVVEAAAAGPEAVQRYISIVNGFTGLLEEIENYPRTGRRRRPPAPDAIAREALIGGIVWVIYDRIVSGQTEQLPELLPQLTHFLLTPFLGEQEAAAVAYADDEGDSTPAAPLRAAAAARGPRR